MSITRKVFLCLGFCWLIFNAFMWMISIPYNAAPDESTHLTTAYFIYSNNRLPVFGKDMDATIDYFSHVRTSSNQATVLLNKLQIVYSVQPYIGYIVSAVFMKILSLIDINFITFYARLTSLFSYILFIYCVWLISKKIFAKNQVLYLLIPWFVANIPQVTFLASYTNNDITSLAIGSFIIYNWVLFFYVKKNKLPNPLVSGIALGLLVYTKLNYYILFPFTILIYIIQTYSIAKNSCEAGKWLVWMEVAAIIVASPPLIRNYYYYGDPLGFTPFNSLARTIWEPYFDVNKTSFIKAISILYPAWFELTFKTFIAVFDWVSLYLSDYFYTIIKWCGIVAFIGFIKYIFENYRKIFYSDYKWLFIALFMLLPLSLLLSLWNTYTIGYQPQGRYLFPALIPIAAGFCVGWVSLFNRRKLQIIMAIFLSIGMTAFNGYCLYGLIRPHYANNPYYKQLKNAPYHLGWNYYFFKV